MFVAEDRARVQDQVQRILQSETFRAADVLRRLMGFLAEKAIAGEADRLKEYTIGLDAFGKPPSYDPRHDAIVRLQVGRLRQKLGEYYRGEGKDDPIVLDLPKGHFKIVWESRLTAPEPPPAVEVAVSEKIPAASQSFGRWRLATLALAAALLICAAWAIDTTVQLSRARQSEASLSPRTPDLDQLWNPFFGTGRHLTITVADPLFIVVPDTNFMFRPQSVNRWGQATGNAEVSAVRRALGNPEIQPYSNLIWRGEAASVFLLAKFLAARQPDLSFSTSGELTLKDLSENDVLLIGSHGDLIDKLAGIPLQPELVQIPEGVENLHPRPGEPAVFKDMPKGQWGRDGEIFALVSHMPGPLGKTSLDIFTSHRTWGRMGAVQAFTDPAWAKILVEKLKGPSGKMPQYYQVLLKIKFRDWVSTDISYVLHRDLAPVQNASGTE